jgi:hypothetical protein
VLTAGTWDITLSATVGVDGVGGTGAFFVNAAIFDTSTLLAESGSSIYAVSSTLHYDTVACLCRVIVPFGTTKTLTASGRIAIITGVPSLSSLYVGFSPYTLSKWVAERKA